MQYGSHFYVFSKVRRTWPLNEVPPFESLHTNSREWPSKRKLSFKKQHFPLVMSEYSVHYGYNSQVCG